MIAAARRRARALAGDHRGATLVEFAIVSPVLMIMLMGLFDLCHQMYAQSILEGAVQKAGRDSAIEGGADRVTDLDGKVYAMVKQIARGSTYVTSRKSYTSFSNVKPEPFTDTNNNGRRDAKECFEDVNGNKNWDADPGRNSQGGADDVTLYTFTLTYPRLFPAAGLIGLPSDNTITASTLLKNQPYARRFTSAVQTVCT